MTTTSENRRAALYAGVVTLLLAPVTTIITLYITKYFQKASIQVVSAVVYVKSQPNKITLDTFRKVQDNYTLNSAVNLQKKANNSAKSCFDWIESGYIFYECLENQIKALDSAQASVTEERELIESASISGKTGKGLAMLLSRSRLNDPFLWATSFLKAIDRSQEFDISDVLEPYIYQLDQATTTIKLLKEEFDSLRSKGIPQRSQDAAFYVGLLNTGDSDTVVFAKGQAEVGSANLVLRPLNQDGYQVVIEAKRFFYLKVTVDENLNNKVNLTEWYQILERRASEVLTLRIDSLDGMVVATSRMPTTDVYQYPD